MLLAAMLAWCCACWEALTALLAWVICLLCWMACRQSLFVVGQSACYMFFAACPFTMPRVILWTASLSFLLYLLAQPCGCAPCQSAKSMQGDILCSDESAICQCPLHCQQMIHVHSAGLQAGQATAKPKPVFGRLEGDFVTTAPDVPKKVLSESKA